MMKNGAIVNIRTESGCNPRDGEYSLSLVSTLAPLVLSSPGDGDVPLIEACIDEAIHSDDYPLPEEGLIEVWIREAVEQEDVHLIRYYEVAHWLVVLDDTPEAKQ